MSTPSSSNKPASSMAELMARQSSKSPLVTLQKGENISGVIKKLTSSDIRVDVNAKTDAMVLEKDRKILQQILKSVKVGDTVQVTVLSPESEYGYPVVSLRRFIDERLWQEAEKLMRSQTSLEGVIAESTRGGYVVDLPIGISGFLPNSQLLPNTPRAEVETGQKSPLLNQKITVHVAEVNKSAKKLIVSEKSPLTAADFQALMNAFKVGQKISAIVSNSAQFGVFVLIHIKDNQYIDGLVHVSELAWEADEQNPGDFTPGQQIECVITGFDRDAKRVELSIKKLTEDPFQELLKGLEVDQRVNGVVTKVDDTGVTVDVSVNGKQVEGLIKKEKIPVGTTYTEGQEINATVAQIDTRRHKLLLAPVLLRKTIGYR